MIRTLFIVICLNDITSEIYDTKRYWHDQRERFFNTIKTERLNLFKFNTTKELDEAVNKFALILYKHLRPHSYNKHLEEIFKTDMNKNENAENTKKF